MNDHFEACNVPTDVNDLHLSFHAKRRLNQRGIDLNALQIALDCGMRRRSHGDWIFLLTDRALHNTAHEKECDRLRGLCLVITASNVVRTVKWDRQCRTRGGILRRCKQQDKQQNQLSNHDLRVACRFIHTRHGIFSTNALNESFLAA